ncbi:MAG: DUF411 domain-containing protein [Acidimicrobiia bacterium]
MLDDLTGVFEHVLTVVCDDQALEVDELLGQGVEEWPPEFLAQTQGGSELRGHQDRVGNRREFDTPHPVGHTGKCGPRRFVGEARLAAAAGTGEREQPATRELRSQGFDNELGIDDEVASCHTAEVDGYVIEGHVPAEAIQRLLTEGPDAIGLALPGMLADSPGMDDTPADWAAQPVVLVHADGSLSDWDW